MCCLGSRKGNVHNRCSATIKDGTRCKRTAADGFEGCWQHKEFYMPPPPPPSTECPICFELALEPSVLPCSHAFHRECVTRWANANSGNPTCPCCRAPFEKVDIEQEWRPVGIVRIPRRRRFRPPRQQQVVRVVVY